MATQNQDQSPLQAAFADQQTPTTPDPFASLGGGTYVNGGWLPPGMGGSATPAAPAPATSGQTSSYPAGQEPTTPDPFASLGGGTYANGGWTPPGMTPPAAAGAPAAGAPGGTPTAASSPGVQAQAGDKLSSYLTQAEYDPNDPVLRRQVDQFAARTDRSRREAIDDAAERASTGGDNLSAIERAALTERAGQQVGEFESRLAQQQLERRASQTMDALKLALAQGDSEKARALQLQLAQLDAAVKRESTAASSALGNRELDIRDRLGSRGLDLDAVRAALQQQQFGQNLGYQIGATEAQLNNNALRYAWE